MTTDTQTAIQPKQNRWAWRFTLLTALMALSFVAIVLALVRYVREGAKRQSTSNNFHQIASALHNFDSAHNRLPHPVRFADGVNSPFVHHQDPTARPLHSWRFAIMHLIMSDTSDTAFDQPWDAPANARWRTVPQVYAYGGWGDGAFDSRNPNSVPTSTCAFAITGPGTAFGDGDTEEPRSLEEIDGDTILVVEVRNSGLHWMAPGDFDIRTMPTTIDDPDGCGISSKHGSGFHVIFADTTVWYLRNDVPFDQLAKFFTVEGAKTHDRDIVLGPYVVD
jgi:hypothetical protein